MGASEATEYDAEMFFTHLSVLWQSDTLLHILITFYSRVFYLDTPSNARKNGLKVSTSKEAAIEARSVIDKIRVHQIDTK